MEAKHAGFMHASLNVNYLFLPAPFSRIEFMRFWMDYSDNAFHTFLGLDSVIYLAVNGTVTNLPVFISSKISKIVFPKMNKAFTGFGTAWG